jgi:hypothetical protein
VAGRCNSSSICTLGAVTLHCIDKTSRCGGCNHIRSCTRNVGQVHLLKLAIAAAAQAVATAASGLFLLHGESSKRQAFVLCVCVL